MSLPAMCQEVRRRNEGKGAQHKLLRALRLETRTEFCKFLALSANLLSVSSSFLYPSTTLFICDTTVNYSTVLCCTFQSLVLYLSICILCNLTSSERHILSFLLHHICQTADSILLVTFQINIFHTHTLFSLDTKYEVSLDVLILNVCDAVSLYL